MSLESVYRVQRELITILQFCLLNTESCRKQDPTRLNHHQLHERLDNLNFNRFETITLNIYRENTHFYLLHGTLSFHTSARTLVYNHDLNVTHH